LPDGFVFFGIESGDIAISDGLLKIWIFNIVCFLINQPFLLMRVELIEINWCKWN